MKKIGIFTVVALISCMCFGCGAREEVSEQKKDNSSVVSEEKTTFGKGGAYLAGDIDNETGNELESEKETEAIPNNGPVEAVVDESFTGEYGYIVKNSVYDYSNRFETVYPWMDGVNMPFDKIENCAVSFNEQGLCMENVQEEVFDGYVESFKAQGYSVREAGSTIYLYKDGMVIEFERVDASVEVSIFTGNVCSERAVTMNMVRNMLDVDSRLSWNEKYEEYILIEVQHENISKLGYYEFIAISPEFLLDNEDWMAKPYYILADSEKLRYCDMVGDCLNYPMLPYMVYNDEGEMNLVITHSDTLQGEPSGNVTIAEWHDGTFSLDMESNEPKVITMGICTDGKIEYYKIRKKPEISVEDGAKDSWEIEGEYKIPY